MTQFLLRTVLVIGVVLLVGASASAHPHVWVTMEGQLVYAPDGSVTGVRYDWTFDDMFSAFATQGIDAKTKGQFSRQELAPLAQENVGSLKEFDYFTFAKANGKKVEMKDPTDYYLDYNSKDTVLTLHFTVPFKTPIKAKELNLDIYDPEYFVDFSFKDVKSPIGLAGAPTACKLTIARPKDLAAPPGQQLGEAFFNQLSAADNWGAQFANKILVKCP
jgi:ABC-type uncharacterized transport system substrate-binding protein